jgi:ubiquilin
MQGMAQPNPAMLSAMLNDPGMMSMMSQMMSQPGFIEQMSAVNPQFADMARNPMMRQMMSSPEALRAALQMQASMQGTPPQLGYFPSPPPAMAPGTSTGTTSQALNLDFSSLFSPAAANNTATNPSAVVQQQQQQQAVTPAVRFASQLQQLSDMGFSDQAANLRALAAVNGNVQAAVERLLLG